MIKLVEIFNIVLEGSYDDEGVADKLYPNFRVDPSGENIKALKHLKQQEDEMGNGKLVGRVLGVHIYLNPHNLKHFQSAVRAIGDIHGNLYVSQHTGNFVHDTMGEALDINMDKNNHHIMRLLRLGSANTFVNVGSCEDREPCERIIEALRHRHPQYKFFPRWL